MFNEIPSSKCMKGVGTHPKPRMVPYHMPMCLCPLLLQARRIWFLDIDKVALEPVCFLGPGKVSKRRAIGADLAEDQNAKYICCWQGAQSQRRDEEWAGCYREQLSTKEQSVRYWHDEWGYLGLYQ